ncbi:MAG: hypothetical protein JWM85_3623 [Acidimicrobiaceae bacterium]|nr:hypothetical protein [Acidimicrobiaceae bacterium]MDF2435446.1 hypothetical protein [Mucilaginibacter sp.]
MDDLPHFKDDDFRLLFLDIDDVLNSVKTSVVYGTYPFPSTVIVSEGRDPRTGAATNSLTLLDSPPVRDVGAFDQANIKLINKLCKVTDTHIVLSSSWRLGLDVDQVREMLEYIGIDSSRVIGRTGQGSVGWNRGREIQEFLSGLEGDMSYLIDCGLVTPSLYGKSLKPKSYVIIDDCDDMLDEQKEANFVHVEDLEGLTLANAVDAGKILTDFAFSIYSLSK